MLHKLTLFTLMFWLCLGNVKAADDDLLDIVTSMVDSFVKAMTLYNEEKTPIEWKDAPDANGNYKAGRYDGIPTEKLADFKIRQQVYINEIKAIRLDPLPADMQTQVNAYRNMLLDTILATQYSSREGVDNYNQQAVKAQKFLHTFQFKDVRTALQELEDDERGREGTGGEQPQPRPPYVHPDPPSTGPTGDLPPNEPPRGPYVRKKAEEEARIICGGGRVEYDDDDGVIRTPPFPPPPPAVIVANYKIIIEIAITQLDDVKTPKTKEEAPAAIAKFKAINSSLCPQDFRYPYEVVRQMQILLCEQVAATGEQPAGEMLAEFADASKEMMTVARKYKVSLSPKVEIHFALNQMAGLPPPSSKENADRAVATLKAADTSFCPKDFQSAFDSFRKVMIEICEKAAVSGRPPAELFIKFTEANAALNVVLEKYGVEKMEM